MNIHDWVETQYTKSIQQLEKLVSISSGSYDKEGIQKCFKEVESQLSILKPDSLIYHQDKQSPNNPILECIKRPNADIQCCFVIHIDTVFNDADNFTTFTKISDTTATGPGVIDAKGGLIVLIKTLEAIEASSFKSSIGWTLLINSDEEIGSLSSKSLLQEKAKKATYGFVFEPAMTNGAMITDRPGSANIIIQSSGKSAHAGRHFHEGKNAITSLMDFLTIKSIFESTKETLINIGTIQGGTRENIVPDFATSKLNIRSKTTPLLHETIQTIQHHASKHSHLKVIIESLRPAKPKTPQTETLFNILQNIAKEHNISLPLTSSFGVCDGNFLQDAGLPTIDTLGPIGSGMHTTNETIYLPSLKDKIVLTYLLIENLITQKSTP